MDEQEFINEAKKQGLNEEEIKSVIDTHGRLKRHFKEIPYNKLLEQYIIAKREKELETLRTITVKRG